MKIVLTKGLTYTNLHFRAEKGKPVDVPEELGKKLVKSGHFERIAEIPIEEQYDIPDQDPEDDDQEQADQNQEGEDNGEDDQNPKGEDHGEGDQNPKFGKSDLTAEKVAAMNKTELTALAAKEGIDISSCKNNEERIERIKGALGLVSFADLGLEE
jgi:ABC-type Zn2+ transport system substrate-binding protein/surface adhesin